MLPRRQRVIVTALLCVAAAWGLAWAGFRWARGSRMTADKVRAYVEITDISSLRGAGRAAALRELARRINALPLEERRRFRMSRAWDRWFQAMTEPEKGEFLEATLPTGFQQMLASFEQMPEQNRRVAVRDALKRLREAREELGEEHEASNESAAEVPPVVSEEIQQKIIQVGLKSYYSESSAQTKAELAPVLEEIQRMMESGRFLRGGRHRHE